MIILLWLVSFTLLIAGIVGLQMGKESGIAPMAIGAVGAFIALAIDSVASKVDKLIKHLGIDDEPES